MNYILFLLPIVTHAHINVTLVISGSKDVASVEITGEDTVVIGRKERDIFQLGDERIKSAFLKYVGRIPDDVYLKGPMPWNDAYNIYGWSQVKRKLYPTKAKIISVQTKPIKVSCEKFMNNGTSEKIFNVEIPQGTRDTIRYSWEERGKFSTERISYNVIIVSNAGLNKTTVSYKPQWGEKWSNLQNTTVLSGIGIKMTLPPGKEAVSIITAISRSVDIQIDYVATLEGVAVGYYNERYKNTLFWKYNINDLLSAEKLPQEIFSQEFIKVNLITDVGVFVADSFSVSSLSCKV